jgi:hypothetical protein
MADKMDTKEKQIEWFKKQAEIDLAVSQLFNKVSDLVVSNS